MKTTLWIKTPFPYDTRGEGAWHECTTTYERRLWAKHNAAKWGLPTAEGEKPTDG